jgi:hypothetical protein
MGLISWANWECQMLRARLLPLEYVKKRLDSMPLWVAKMGTRVKSRLDPSSADPFSHAN